MGDDGPVISLTYPILIRPLFDLVGRHGNDKTIPNANVQASFDRVDIQCPGWSHDFVMQLIKATDLPVTSLNESILRLESSFNSEGCRVNRTEDIFTDLNRKALNLKKILSKIPDEIADRRRFLETIKEIASAIKKLLDCVHQVTEYLPTTIGRQVLEQRKKEFVKFSKRFSNTLKDFFKDGQVNPVFYSANCLINQTNLIVQTVKEKCE